MTSTYLNECKDVMSSCQKRKLNHAIRHIQSNVSVLIKFLAAAYNLIETCQHKLNSCIIMAILKIMDCTSLEISSLQTALPIDAAPTDNIEAGLSRFAALKAKIVKKLIKKQAFIAQIVKESLQEVVTSEFLKSTIAKFEHVIEELVREAADIFLAYETKATVMLVSDLGPDVTMACDSSEPEAEAETEPEADTIIAEPEDQSEQADRSRSFRVQTSSSCSPNLQSRPSATPWNIPPTVAFVDRDASCAEAQELARKAQELARTLADAKAAAKVEAAKSAKAAWEIIALKAELKRMGRTSPRTDGN